MKTIDSFERYYLSTEQYGVTSEDKIFEVYRRQKEMNPDTEPYRI
jgi:hypothetical protein